MFKQFDNSIKRFVMMKIIYLHYMYAMTFSLHEKGGVGEEHVGLREEEEEDAWTKCLS